VLEPDLVVHDKIVAIAEPILRGHLPLHSQPPPGGGRSPSPFATTCLSSIFAVADDGSPGELVRAAAGGDETAWSRLVDRYASLVWSVTRAHRLAATDAADVSQTVWLRLVEHLDRLDDADRVAGWLLVTTRRECLRVLRTGGKVDLVDDVDHVDVRSDDPAVRLDDRARAAALWRAVERLPGRCHLLVRLLLLDPPATYEDIGEAMDMPIGSIGPTRGRCLQKLREDLRSSGITAPSTGSV